MNLQNLFLHCRIVIYKHALAVRIVFTFNEPVERFFSQTIIHGKTGNTVLRKGLRQICRVVTEDNESVCALDQNAEQAIAMSRRMHKLNCTVTEHIITLSHRANTAALIRKGVDITDTCPCVYIPRF